MNRVCLGLVAAGTFASGVDAYVTAGLLPGISAGLGVSVGAAGQGVTVFTAAYALSAPLLATALAGRPARAVLPAALALFAAGNAVTALAPDLTTYLVARALTGVGAGLFTPTAVTACASAEPPGRRGRVLGLLWSANSAGTVVGVPLGLQLTAAAGWRWTVGGVAVVATVVLLGLLRWPPRVRLSAPPSARERLRLLGDRELLAVVGVTALAAAGSLGLYTYIAQVTPVTATGSVTELLLVWGAGGLVGNLVVGRVCDRTGRPHLVVAWVVALLAVALLTVAATRTTPAVLGAVALWGAAGWSLGTPQQQTLMALRPDLGAAAVALNGSALCVGAAAGALAGGAALSARVPPSALPVAAAVIVGCALVVQLRLTAGRPTTTSQEV